MDLGDPIRVIEVQSFEEPVPSTAALSRLYTRWQAKRSGSYENRSWGVA